MSESELWQGGTRRVRRDEADGAERGGPARSHPPRCAGRRRRRVRTRVAEAALAVLVALGGLTTADRAHADVPDFLKLNVLGGDRRATLLWEEADPGSSPLIRYEYRYKSTGNFPAAWTEVPNGTDLVPDPGGLIVYAVPDALTNGTTYTFQIRAVNSSGAGPVDTISEVSATTVANSPAVSMIEIGGFPRVPGVVTVDVWEDFALRFTDADGTVKTYGDALQHFKITYQWFRVDGATETPVGPRNTTSGRIGSYYPLTDADVGKQIKVKVSFVDDRGNPEELSAVFPSGTDTILPRALCPAPSHTGGAIRIWSGTMNTNDPSRNSDGEVVRYGVNAGFDFVPREFTVEAGGNTYKIDRAYRAVSGSQIGKLVFGLESNLTSTDQNRLILHVCNEQYRFVDATRDDPDHDYLWDSDLDWSNIFSRTLYLSYDAVPPILARVARTGASLTLTFGEELDADSVPALDAFPVTVNGEEAALASGSTATLEGGTLTLTLDSAPGPDATVTVSYEMPTSGNTLRDLAQNEVASFGKRVVAEEREQEQATGVVAPWLARFGRTAAEQVADAVASRLATPRRPGLELSLGGQRFAVAPAQAVAAQEARARAAQPVALTSRFLDGAGGGALSGAESRALTGHELLAASSFDFVGGTEGSGLIGLWGRVALSEFEGREDDLAIDGEVASAMLGADVTQGRVTIGMLVSRAEGEGTYRSALERGTIESTLTGLYPYARYALSERLSAWGTAGYGEGVLMLMPEEQAAIETDMDMVMAAAGLRGVVKSAGEGEHIEVAAVADALGMRSTSDAVNDSEQTLVPAADVYATRLRLGIEGTFHGIEGGGHRLVPTLEVGLRRDRGDAAYGYGLDVGAGIVWSVPRAGIEVSVRGRGLTSHEEEGFRQSGVAGSVSWDTDPSSARGLSLSLAQTVGGAASGGAAALLARRTMAGLAASDDRAAHDNQRLEARLGYGIAVFDGSFIATPEAGFTLSEAERTLGLGWRVGLARRDRVSVDFGLEATRREAVNGDGPPPAHGVGVRLTAGW